MYFLLVSFIYIYIYYWCPFTSFHFLFMSSDFLSFPIHFLSVPFHFVKAERSTNSKDNQIFVLLNSFTKTLNFKPKSIGQGVTHRSPEKWFFQKRTVVNKVLVELQCESIEIPSVPFIFDSCSSISFSFPLISVHIHSFPSKSNRKWMHQKAIWSN